ncbi:MAG TPA: DedA family protein [Terriglobia bacterium]|nr:DedA family protein [Terriglobia bacterium]
MAHHLFIALSHFFHHYGYWTVFGATLLENMGIPVPGETVMLFAGFLARRGDLHLVWAILAAIGGATVGECIGYVIGHLGGEAFIERYRKKMLISPRIYERGRAIFLKNAGWAILAARFVSGFREIIGILAGVFGMPPPRFVFFNFVGAIIWSIAIGSAGYFLGGWGKLLHFLARIDLIALIVFAAVIAFLGIRQWLRVRSAKQKPL